MSIVLSVAFSGSLKAQTYYTHPLDSCVRTLRVIADDDFRKLPVLDMEGNTHIEVSFDFLSDDQQWLSYSVVHCDARWEQDDLSEMDYLDGFLPVHVEDVAPSFNTFTNYYHYSATFPNDDVELLVSGNYAVIFHYDNEPDNVVAVATFSVSEQKAFVNGTVSSNTDIDFQALHQQLTMDVAWSNSQMPDLNPADDLQILVQQNRRRDNQRWITRPTRMHTGHAYFEHERDLIFEAGSHWYRFEFTDHRYPGLGVDHVRYHAPFHYAYLNPVKSNPAGNYRYDQDQHGHYLVRALHVDDSDTEAEYFKAVFTLDAPASLNSRGIYLVGDLTCQEIGDETRMEYDPERGVYHKEMMLKQGAYNYQYLVPAGDRLTTAFTSGNHYETPNEYQVWVYYRPFGARYDRLIGVGTLGK